MDFLPKTVHLQGGDTRKTPNLANHGKHTEDKTPPHSNPSLKIFFFDVRMNTVRTRVSSLLIVLIINEKPVPFPLRYFQLKSKVVNILVNGKTTPPWVFWLERIERVWRDLVDLEGVSWGGVLSSVDSV